eukprot:gene12828-biopygen4973
MWCGKSTSQTHSGPRTEALCGSHLRFPPRLAVATGVGECGGSHAGWPVLVQQGGACKVPSSVTQRWNPTHPRRCLTLNGNGEMQRHNGNLDHV